ncbi:MAG: capsule biosynthesis protein CapB, partial [Myxococcota bacterium]
HAVRRARSALPLVVGGWGTRGKSGTERLKAGLFEGLGVPLLSKTTGCEAMVLHAPPGGHALELFLFRPYDKATIWEQVDVVRLAAAMGARTMLWECMGLNPIYVDLLQAGWMRDDLATLTNAYPDHEDIQGPTGMDVARVIGGFSPPDALVFTTEANMRPVLAEEARRRGTTMEAVSRVDRELVPRDLIDRMPHAEHPANVALAAAVAVALGLPKVEAVGLMAEHVVPDLGALIIYPRARHMGRDVVFANGMSANDTLSFRHNWRRTGFAAHDHLAEPARWLVTVVNNRADRVARSRVFAQILANDANAHRHVLIGTNLRGLARYLETSVDERLAGHVLDGDPARVDALFAHLRLVEPGALGAACARRLG